MKYVLAIIALLFLYVWIGSLAHGQQPPKSATAPPPGVMLSEPSYPLSPEERGKVRDLQYQSDQLEIQNSNLLLQIEKNKAQQAALLDKIGSIAFQFAASKKIDPNQYELDPKEVRLNKKK